MSRVEQFLYKNVFKTLRQFGVYTPSEECEHKFLYRKAHHIARSVPGAKLYEYGTLCGATAITMGMGIRHAKELALARGEIVNARLISVDNYRAFRESKNSRFAPPDEVRENVRKCEVEDSVEILEMDDLEHIASLENRSVDFAFVDSLHSYPHVTKTLDLILPKMRQDSLLCGHDYILDSTGVIYAVEDFRQRYPANICGFGLEYSTWWCMIRTAIK